jgi:hypothetical protein
MPGGELASADPTPKTKTTAFKSPGPVQRFLAIHVATFNALTHQRHLLRRPHFKELRADSFCTWAGASATA